jgi:multidrug resistance efflux pump
MKRIILCLVVVAAATGCYLWRKTQGPEILRLPGTVEVQEVRLGSRLGGRVAAVHVQEGQLVEAGQVLVTFEPHDLAARRDQATGRLAGARAALERAEHGPLPEEVAEARGAAEAAGARLARARAGYREEQKRQARGDLDAALAEVKQADEEFDRARYLSGVGVASPSDYDAALAARDRARSRARAALAVHDMMVRGSRDEDIDEAQADLARLNARYQLLLRGTRDEDRAAAAAAVAEAEAQLAEAEANLREAAVVVTERCLIETLSVRAGSLVPAGQPVVVAHRADDLWVKANVPASELGRLRVGQAVEVTVDSHPGRRFRGEVVQIAASSEFTPRNVQSADERQHQVFAVKARVADPGGVFKSGMAAEVFVLPAEGL